MIPDTMMLPSRSPENLGISPTKIHSPALPVKVQFSASSSNGLWTIAGVPNKIGHVSRSKDAPLSQLVHPDLPKGANYVKSIANSAIEIARIKSLEDGVGPVSIVRIDFYYHVKIESNVPGQTTIFRCHPKWNNDSKAGISGREWFDWVEVNWEKGDGSSSYTVPAKLLLWGNVIFSNTTTILLACIRSLKSSTEMKIHKRMFFARGDTLCNDTTELSVVEFHNILSAAFVVPALKPQESRKSLKPQEVLEQIRKDNFYVAMPPRNLWKSIGWDQKLTSER